MRNMVLLCYLSTLNMLNGHKNTEIQLAPKQGLPCIGSSGSQTLAEFPNFSRKDSFPQNLD